MQEVNNNFKYFEIGCFEIRTYTPMEVEEIILGKRKYTEISSQEPNDDAHKVSSVGLKKIRHSVTTISRDPIKINKMQIQAHFPTKEDFQEIFNNEPVDIVNSNGEVIISYRPGVLIQKLGDEEIKTIFENAVRIPKRNTSRGAAAGLIDPKIYPEGLYQISEGMPYIAYKKKENGKVGSKAMSNPMQTGVIGYGNMKKNAASTTYSPRRSDKMAKAFGRINQIFNEQMPEIGKKQLEKYNAINNKQKPNPLGHEGCGFTSVGVNLDKGTAYHKDGTKTHLKDGYELIVTLGEYKGGALVLPEYKMAFQMPPNSLIAFQATKFFHGNMPISIDKNSHRISLVGYCSNNFVKNSKNNQNEDSKESLIEEAHRISANRKEFSYKGPPYSFLPAQKLKTKGYNFIDAPVVALKRFFSFKIEDVSKNLSESSIIELGQHIKNTVTVTPRYIEGTGPKEHHDFVWGLLNKSFEIKLIQLKKKNHPPHLKIKAQFNCKRNCDLLKRIIKSYLVDIEIPGLPESQILLKDIVLMGNIISSNNVEQMVTKSLDKNFNKGRQAYYPVLFRAASWLKNYEYLLKENEKN